MYEEETLTEVAAAQTPAIETTVQKAAIVAPSAQEEVPEPETVVEEAPTEPEEVQELPEEEIPEEVQEQAPVADSGNTETFKVVTIKTGTGSNGIPFSKIVAMNDDGKTEALVAKGEENVAAASVLKKDSKFTFTIEEVLPGFTLIQDIEEVK
jgi:hypothetical protein